MAANGSSMAASANAANVSWLANGQCIISGKALNIS
jgi:hypothetical protein